MPRSTSQNDLQIAKASLQSHPQPSTEFNNLAPYQDQIYNRYSNDFKEQEISFPEQIHEVPKQESPPQLQHTEESKQSYINEESKHSSHEKIDSSKGHQEIVSLLSNPNMLFNDASSIKYNSIDHQNMSNFSIPSITGDIMKPKFDGLDGM